MNTNFDQVSTKSSRHFFVAFTLNPASNSVGARVGSLVKSYGKPGWSLARRAHAGFPERHQTSQINWASGSLCKSKGNPDRSQLGNLIWDFRSNVGMARATTGESQDFQSCLNYYRLGRRQEIPH